MSAPRHTPLTNADPAACRSVIVGLHLPNDTPPVSRLPPGAESPPAEDAIEPSDSSKPARKRLPSHRVPACRACNKAKRSCNRGTPCANCVKRSIRCEYPQSFEYYKSAHAKSRERLRKQRVLDYQATKLSSQAAVHPLETSDETTNLDTSPQPVNAGQNGPGTTERGTTPPETPVEHDSPFPEFPRPPTQHPPQRSRLDAASLAADDFIAEIFSMLPSTDSSADLDIMELLSPSEAIGEPDEPAPEQQTLSPHTERGPPTPPNEDWQHLDLFQVAFDQRLDHLGAGQTTYMEGQVEPTSHHQNAAPDLDKENTNSSDAQIGDSGHSHAETDSNPEDSGFFDIFAVPQDDGWGPADDGWDWDLSQ